MYKSPIEIIYAQTQTQIEGDILKAIQNYGISVDKNELIQALAYDRDQYNKGYADGKREAMEEIVRCKDCTFCKVDNSVFMKDVFGNENETPNYHCLKGYGYNKPNHFCSYGKRRTDNG